MKIDHDEAVNELFQQPSKASKVKTEVDMQHKRFVYKLIIDNKQTNNKVSLKTLFEKYKEQ